MTIFFILLSLLYMTLDCCEMETETRVAIPQFTTNNSARFLNWWQASSFSRHLSMHIPSTSPVIIQQNGRMATEFSTEGGIVDVLHYDSQKREGRPERRVSFTCPSQYDENPLLLFDGPNKQNWFVHARMDALSQSPMVYLLPAQEESVNHQHYNEEETKTFAIPLDQPHEITAVALHPAENIIAFCCTAEENTHPILHIINKTNDKKPPVCIELPVLLKKIIHYHIDYPRDERPIYYLIGLSQDNYIYEIISGTECRHTQGRNFTCTKKINLPVIAAVCDYNSWKSVLLTMDGKIVTVPNLRYPNTFEHIHTISRADAAFVERISDCDGICNIILKTPTEKQILQCRSDYNWKHLILPVSFVCGLGLFLYLYLCGKK